jgi:hypothetical protein
MVDDSMFFAVFTAHFNEPNPVFSVLHCQKTTLYDGNALRETKFLNICIHTRAFSCDNTALGEYDNDVST